jgi:hypothetical protein
MLVMAPKRFDVSFCKHCDGRVDLGINVSIGSKYVMWINVSISNNQVCTLHFEVLGHQFPNIITTIETKTTIL